MGRRTDRRLVTRYRGEEETVSGDPYRHAPTLGDLDLHLIAEGRTVGTYLGRMEYGPRALGARTIMARAVDRSINDWLNKKLDRTDFMPFAPVVLAERAKDLFDLPIVAVNTSMLLFSSITYGFAMLAMDRKAKGQTLMWLAITGLFGAIPGIGPSIQEWLLGGPAVDNATLNRFFSLHYLLPFVIAALVVVHFWAFHTTGNNNPTGIEVKDEQDTVPFHPYYTAKDGFGVGVFLLGERYI